MQRSVSAIFLLFFFSAASLGAKESVRVAIVDMNSEGLSLDEQNDSLENFRRYFSAQTTFEVLGKNEIDQKLKRENPLQQKTQSLMLSHQKKMAELNLQFQQGRDEYLASDFRKSVEIFENVWDQLPEASLQVQASFVVRLLSYIGASFYFLGEKSASKTYFGAIRDLGLSSLFPQKDFPPNVFELFKEVLVETTWPKTRVSFKANRDDFDVIFLGTKLPVVQADSSQIFVSLGHPILDRQQIIFLEKDSTPLLYQASEVPREINFQSLAPLRASTKGLFAPLSSSIPDEALQSVFKSLDADIVLLLEIKKDLQKAYVASGQWLAAKTYERSAVIEERSAELPTMLRLLQEKLSIYLTPEGRVLSVNEGFAATERSEKFQGPQFYKKWWFWTAVGAVVGAGVGSYVLLNPKDELRFSVEEAQ